MDAIIHRVRATSFRTVARELGITRNALIGKVYRWRTRGKPRTSKLDLLYAILLNEGPLTRAEVQRRGFSSNSLQRLCLRGDAYRVVIFRGVPKEGESIYLYHSRLNAKTPTNGGAEGL